MELGVKKSSKKLLQYTFAPFTETSTQALKLNKILSAILNREP